jgi:hypothetical protein
MRIGVMYSQEETRREGSGRNALCDRLSVVRKEGTHSPVLNFLSLSLSVMNPMTRFPILAHSHQQADSLDSVDLCTYIESGDENENELV